MPPAPPSTWRSSAPTCVPYGAPCRGSGGHRARICLAVKAAAYGHGAVPVARAALQAGVSAFGVATVAEGVELRAAGITAPILLFSLPLPEEASEIVRARLTALCADAALGRDLARAAGRAGRTVAVHLKLDTGMGRIGCTPDAAAELAQELRRHPALRLTGVCTHFALADQADQEFTPDATRGLQPGRRGDPGPPPDCCVMPPIRGRSSVCRRRIWTWYDPGSSPTATTPASASRAPSRYGR